MSTTDELTLVDPLWWVTHQDALDEALAAAILEAHPAFLDEAAQHPLFAALVAAFQARADIDDRLTYTVEEAATLLGISRSFAYEAVARGEIPNLRMGRRILVPKAALERFLAAAGDQGPPARRDDDGPPSGSSDPE